MNRLISVFPMQGKQTMTSAMNGSLTLLLIVILIDWGSVGDASLTTKQLQAPLPPPAAWPQCGSAIRRRSCPMAKF
ncbi:MAG: hypothetical protein L0226_13290 [Acidobacteria bacterium]|nr:hypothetical protein [Acidobacteriota bacterium]